MFKSPYRLYLAVNIDAKILLGCRKIDLLCGAIIFVAKLCIYFFKLPAKWIIAPAISNNIYKKRKRSVYSK